MNSPFRNNMMTLQGNQRNCAMPLAMAPTAVAAQTHPGARGPLARPVYVDALNIITLQL